MAKPTHVPHQEPKNEGDTFYEAMPATADRFRFPDMEAEEKLSDEDRLTVDETKATAIVTLILTALVAIGLALLLWRGLDTIKSVTPAQNGTSSSLEL